MEAKVEAVALDAFEELATGGAGLADEPSRSDGGSLDFEKPGRAAVEAGFGGD